MLLSRRYQIFTQYIARKAADLHEEFKSNPRILHQVIDSQYYWESLKLDVDRGIAFDSTDGTGRILIGPSMMNPSTLDSLPDRPREIAEAYIDMIIFDVMPSDNANLRLSSQRLNVLFAKKILGDLLLACAIDQQEIEVLIGQIDRFFNKMADARRSHRDNYNGNAYQRFACDIDDYIDNPSGLKDVIDFLTRAKEKKAREMQLLRIATINPELPPYSER